MNLNLLQNPDGHNMDVMAERLKFKTGKKHY